ncbi:MAG: M48 family metallopeptidase [Gammaproteobacteria bacterium]|nr:M48 family metallopeptidase [Gammaproteobacteria bacterium]
MPTTLAESRFLHAEPEALAYTLRRARRKTLCLVVRRDGGIEVRAPLRLGLGEIEGFVRERLPWLRRKQAEFAARPALVLADGGRVPFLGGELVLKIEAGRPKALRLGEALHLRVMDPGDAAQVRARLEAWYRGQAPLILGERFEAVWAAAAPWGLPRPDLRLRWMRSRWGSCSRDGRVCLNIQLAKAHPDAIDYVIAHEFCHLREFNHGPGFYRLLAQLMPDFARRRELLKAVGSLRED